MRGLCVIAIKHAQCEFKDVGKLKNNVIIENKWLDA